MDSGINSDSDHQLECQLMKRDLMLMVLLVLLKKILIVLDKPWEIEPCPYSSNLGKKLPNQLTVPVLMISEDKTLMSVKIFHSNIPMLMVCGSMSITDTLLLNKKSTLLSLVKTLTKLLPFHLLCIMLHQPNFSLT
jgi:hypothetical protein